jgi:lysozyme
MVDQVKSSQRRPLALIVGTAAASILFALVPKQEGTVYRTYRDLGGVLTYCTGATEDAVWGKAYTPAECRAQLDRDLARHAEGAMACITVPTTEGQRVAFTDLAYNIGVANFCGSWVVRKTNAGDKAGGCAAISSWNKVKKWKPVVLQDGTVLLDAHGRPVMHWVYEPVAGLTKRRAIERDYCERGL